MDAVADGQFLKRDGSTVVGAMAGAGGLGDVVGPASSVDAEIALFDSTTGKLLKRATGSGFVKATSGVYSAVNLDTLLGWIIDGGGATITTGIKGDLGPIPFACTILEVSMLADQPGSIVVDIWKDTYANFPPTDADSITASAPPTISTATKSQDSTLTGWTTAISAGDILRYNVDSVTDLQRVTIALKVRRA
jgi:hypothetical protein